MDKNNPRNTSPDFDHLFYLRIFEGCNLHCDHCFIPSNPKKMDLDHFPLAAEKLMGISKSGDTLLVQWHGGEPTALPAGYFRQAIGGINAGVTDRKVVHGIQTNLMTYNDDWRDIFREYFDSSVGVSWDYEIRKTKLVRKTILSTKKNSGPISKN
jgi:sulfatase maturation enzyme AslB (radical SAM superfamily)